MADITMCKGKGCDKTNTCYRYRANACIYSQSYFIESPIDKDGYCDSYWKM